VWWSGDGFVRALPSEGQGALDALAAAGDALVQPYVPTIASAGELSVVLFEGEVSHAVRKVPAPGALLVQIEHGGTYEPLEAVPADAADLARWVVAAVGHDLLFARVDLLVDEVGSWLVSELEVTEPGLFLHLVDEAADRLVAAVERALS